MIRAFRVLGVVALLTAVGLLALGALAETGSRLRALQCETDEWPMCVEGVDEGAMHPVRVCRCGDKVAVYDRDGRLLERYRIDAGGSGG